MSRWVWKLSIELETATDDRLLIPSIG